MRSRAEGSWLRHAQRRRALLFDLGAFAGGGRLGRSSGPCLPCRSSDTWTLGGDAEGHRQEDDCKPRFSSATLRNRYRSIIPLCRSSASTRGSRPRKALNDSIAEREPPTARISRQKRSPVAGVEHAAVAAAGFLEGLEGVGGEHFGPLVAVVARRIAAAEDVREALREAVPLGREPRPRLRGARRRSVAAPCALPSGSNSLCSKQVEQRELDLAQRLHAALEILGGDHLVVERARQRLAGLGMRRSCRRARPIPSRSSPGTGWAARPRPIRRRRCRTPAVRRLASAGGAGRGRSRGTASARRRG